MDNRSDSRRLRLDEDPCVFGFDHDERGRLSVLGEEGAALDGDGPRDAGCSGWDVPVTGDAESRLVGDKDSLDTTFVHPKK